MRKLSALVAWLFVVSSSSSAAPNAAGIDFFEKKIRPVLVEHCYRCHSVAKKKRGGLLVDSRAGLLEGGDTGPALVPGKPKQSLLLSAIAYSSEDLRMPPKGKLPASVVADFEKWIGMGAPDPRDGLVTAAAGIDLEKGRQFWAFRPLKKPDDPALEGSDWPRTDLDRFILARLRNHELEPVGDASRSQLLRRATFALTGLPPTIEQIRAFEKDDSPNAYENLIDRLLDSRHFGERWGRHWLDVARFAESTGGGRSLLLRDAWRYRDYVIDSFNKDKPYSQFIREQLAGDLLPFDTPQQRAEQLTGSAFLALGPTNYELQDKQVLEMDVIDEQLDTFGRAFLGMTIGCARCHDHKFDPIPTADYYALAGIFHSTKTMIHNNVSKWLEVPLPMSPEVKAKVDAHNAEVKALQKKVNALRAELKKQGKAATPVVSLDHLPGIVLDDTQAKKVGDWQDSTFQKPYLGKGYIHDQNDGKGTKTLTFEPEFTEDGDYEVRFAYTPGGNREKILPITIFSADGEETVFVNEQKPPPIDQHFVSLGTYRFETNNQWFVRISNEGTTNHVIVDAVQFLPKAKIAKKTKPTKKPEPKPDKRQAELKKLEAQLKKLKAAAPKRATTMAVLDADSPHDIAICIRGNYHSQGDKVRRGFLQVLVQGKMPTIPEKKSGRLELADWLTSRDNPLPARVMVNRIWHHLFGQGIVRTVDNFGKMGELPSHPELLDFLAVRFIEQDWSVKKLIREIMLSRTYRLASTDDSGRAAVDPENRLLWRMNRRRLEAEAIRDSILAVSGNLDKTMGGPTIRSGTSIEYGYKFGDNRRSIYTPVFRNRLLELFEVFDFSDPNLVMGRRTTSTVPTQSLFLMNSPFVMEQAEAAAKQTMSATAETDERIDRAYLLTLGRSPSSRERALAKRFVTGSTEDQQQKWERFYQVLFACIDFRYIR